MKLTLDHLRRYAIARSLFKPTTLMRAIEKLGFVQADPIRAPARAQDLTLRHRVVGYRAGELERRYPRLALEEDFFVNYGFLPRAHHALMHPRDARQAWTPARWKQAQAVREFIAERGAVHPREVDAHFAHGKTTNWFGGSSNASTQLLDGMHYRGLLRVARRDGGTRVYAVREDARRWTRPSIDARLDALIDLIVGKYAPLPDASLGQLVSYLGNGVPQWNDARKPALLRARQRLQRARVEGVDWLWPADETRGKPTLETGRTGAPADAVRSGGLGSPPLRTAVGLGLPLRGLHARAQAQARLLRVAAAVARPGDRLGQPVASTGALHAQLHYVDGKPPRDAAFKDALEAELARMRVFLGLSNR